MRLLHIILITVFLFSCDQIKKEQTILNLPLDGATYTFLPDSVDMKWTAYKFTERVGVSGTFKTILIKGMEQSETMLGVFENASFEIPIQSIDTKNPERDAKIIKHFFGTLKKTETITGSVKKLEADGNGVMRVTLNNREKDVPFTLSVDGKIVTLESEINLENFLAQAAVDALNVVCKALHIGADGISKLWPDVKLMLRVQLK